MSAENSVPPDTIATLRIDLLGSDPPIWREIEVPVSMTLKELHAVVQAAMEWEDAHLWEFAVGRERIGGTRAAKLSLHSLLRPRVTKLTYIYDFGDGWGTPAHSDQTSRRRSKFGLSTLYRGRAPGAP
jgi:Plasmid pRiA4b ORF-3-like protein